MKRYKNSDYFVMVDGRVLSSKTGKLKEIKQQICRLGYHAVWLMIDGKRKRKSVHRMVAEVFLNNFENLSDVNHKDGNKSNNNVYNLEWMSHKDNMRHARDNGLFKNKTGAPEKALRNEMVRHLAKRFTQDEISSVLGITQARVSAIINRAT